MTSIRRVRWLIVAIVFALVAVACGGDGEGSDSTQTAATDAPGTTEAGGTTAAPATEAPPAAPPSGDAVTITWYVGLGAGGQPEQIAAQEAVVERFNSEREDINLVLEVVENDVAYDTLATRLTAGGAPDIIGPVGRDGANSFAGRYLDIEPLIAASGLDTTRWPEAAVENFREPDGTLLGLPFASYPSFVYFHRDLFDEAGLPHPPQEYGADGTAVYGEGTEWEGTWDFAKVAEIAQYLTVDADGVDATDAAFDPDNTVQWGFVWQWTDRLFQQGSFWGAGNMLQDDGSAAVPQDWADEWAWYQDAVWGSGFAPGQTELDSELLNGNAFQSGLVAMAGSHLWYTCCIRNDESNRPGDFYDIAVMPSHNGAVTANMHADTFRILDTSENPEAAFEVMEYLLTDAALELLTAYGAAPAEEGLTEAFFASLDERYPQGVNWQVAIDSANYADNPSHEQYVPGWDEYKLRLEDLVSALLSDPALDLAAEIPQLEADLTTIFQNNS